MVPLNHLYAFVLCVLIGIGAAGCGKVESAAVDAVPDDNAVCPAATHQCIEAPPPGWQGPMAIFEAAPDSLFPACGGEYPSLQSDRFGELIAPGDCMCTCGAATGLTCEPASVRAHAISSCIAVGSPVGSATPGGCMPFTQSNSFYSFVPGALMPGGMCRADVASTLGEPAWQVQSRICGGATLQGGCGASQVCAPTPVAEFSPSLCIYSEGESACPDGSAYQERIVRYADYTDGRRCSSCTCGDPTGTCDGSVTLTRPGAGGPVCSPPQESIAIDAIGPGECSINSSTATEARYQATPQASCTPSQGSILGEARGTQAITLCCLR